MPAWLRLAVEVVDDDLVGCRDSGGGDDWHDAVAGYPDGSVASAV
jgi:hypothetical protein